MELCEGGALKDRVVLVAFPTEQNLLDTRKWFYDDEGKEPKLDLETLRVKIQKFNDAEMLRHPCIRKVLEATEKEREAGAEIFVIAQGFGRADSEPELKFAASFILNA